MITIQKIEHTESYREKQENNYINVELRGLSTDTKPTTANGENIDNGSTFIEIDTGKIYFYDLENEQWKEI